VRAREPADRDSGISVLVVEAGPPDSSILIHMPSAFAYPLQGTTYNWAYETEPEPAMDGRRISCPRVA
jgi:choline dehydrogenase